MRVELLHKGYFVKRTHFFGSYSWERVPTCFALLINFFPPPFINLSKRFTRNFAIVRSITMQQRLVDLKEMLLKKHKINGTESHFTQSIIRRKWPLLDLTSTLIEVGLFGGPRGAFHHLNCHPLLPLSCSTRRWKKQLSDWYETQQPIEWVKVLKSASNTL